MEKRRDKIKVKKEKRMEGRIEKEEKTGKR
jgi:hypothetical protein